MLEWLRERFEFSRGESVNNARPMEGLRGFAVLLVFFVHYESLLAPWIVNDTSLMAVASALRTIGNAGVDLFFLLSGYLIYGTLIARRQSFRDFFLRRVRRIYPAFTAVFAMYVALSVVLPAQSKIPPDNAAVYLLTNYLLLPGLWPIQPMITVAWSLSYEMFCYLTLPAMVTGLKLAERSAPARSILFLSIAAVFSVYTAFVGGPIHLIMFIAGILLYEAMKHSRARASSFAGAVALGIGLAGMLLNLANPAGETLEVAIMFVTFFVFGLACFRTPQGWLPRAFSWTPLRWLGNMSYSYYLLHGLTLHGGFLLLSKILPPTGDQSVLHWVLLLPMLVLTLASSAVLFLLIERPFSLVPRAKAGLVTVREAESSK